MLIIFTFELSTIKTIFFQQSLSKNLTTYYEAVTPRFRYSAASDLSFNKDSGVPCKVSISTKRFNSGRDSFGFNSFELRAVRRASLN